MTKTDTSLKKCIINELTTAEYGQITPSSNEYYVLTDGKISSDDVDDTNATNKFVTASNITAWNGKQDALVSGTNIKTINNESILGSGNIEVQGGGGSNLVFENGIEKTGNTVYLPKTNDVAFAISDANGNSVFIVDNNGDIDFQLSEALKSKIRSIDDYEFDADVYMIPCVGQSLAINGGATGSSFSSTYPLSYDTSLVNTNLQDMNTGFCEAFNIAASFYNIPIPSNFKIITCVVGAGGRSINAFGKGTNFYNQVISNINTAKTACDNAGLRMIVPGFMWTQGEEDMRCGGTPSNYGSGEWNPFDYHTKLRSMIDNYNIDIKAITKQDMDVHCFSYQIETHNVYKRYPRIALEQLKLATMDDRMLLAKPMYYMNYNADLVHAPAASYRNMGNMYGLACFTKCVQKKNFKFVHPINFNLDGTTMYIDFETPVVPLEFDTTLITQLSDNNYGFNIYNVTSETSTSDSIQYITEATTRITNVEIVGNSKVKLTLSRTPVAGERLTYGVNGDGWQNIGGYLLPNYQTRGSGRVNGARGCLRDNSQLRNNNSGATLTYLYNWCPIFEYVF